MSIGARIKERRKAKGLTLEELSLHVSVSRQTLSRYETGIIKNIPSDKMEALAWELETTPAYLMGWTEDYYDYDRDPDSRLAQMPVEWFRAWQEEGLSGKEMWQRYLLIEEGTQPIVDGVMPLPDMRAVPLVGSIACGTPVLADQNVQG
jgi:transcriptional regulator with XRE-family HTH domain